MVYFLAYFFYHLCSSSSIVLSQKIDVVVLCYPQTIVLCLCLTWRFSFSLNIYGDGGKLTNVMFVCFNDIKQQAVARNMDNFSLREAVFVDLVDEIFLSSVSLISKAKLFWGGDKQLMAFSIKGSTKNKDTMNCPEKAMK